MYDRDSYCADKFSELVIKFGGLKEINPWDEHIIIQYSFGPKLKLPCTLIKNIDSLQAAISALEPTPRANGDEYYRIDKTGGPNYEKSDGAINLLKELNKISDEQVKNWRSVSQLAPAEFLCEAHECIPAREFHWYLPKNTDCSLPLPDKYFNELLKQCSMTPDVPVLIRYRKDLLNENQIQYIEMLSNKAKNLLVYAFEDVFPPGNFDAEDKVKCDAIELSHNQIDAFKKSPRSLGVQKTKVVGLNFTDLPVYGGMAGVVDLDKFIVLAYHKDIRDFLKQKYKYLKDKSLMSHLNSNGFLVHDFDAQLQNVKRLYNFFISREGDKDFFCCHEVNSNKENDLMLSWGEPEILKNILTKILDEKDKLTEEGTEYSFYSLYYNLPVQCYKREFQSCFEIGQDGSWRAGNGALEYNFDAESLSAHTSHTSHTVSTVRYYSNDVPIESKICTECTIS